jgi:4-methylaminobutanoate oxidase (formaldehyde-forming)
MAGVSVPLYACEHFYILTKPLPGIDGHLPPLGDHDSHLYMRDEVGGLLVGCFEPNAKGLPLEKLPQDFAFELLDEDWDHFEPMMQLALHRLPVLETAEVKMLLNGPESFTPDGGFLLGEAPEVAGFFVGCGMNSMGVTSAGGAGRALAEWIVAGEPNLDLWPVDIRRFAPAHANPAFLAARIPEELCRHYAIAYPGLEPETGRGLRLGPLHDRLAAAGARFGVRAGWERPLWFAGPDEAATVPLRFGRPAWHDAVASECRAAREAVALFDQSSFAKLLVEGPDAEAFLGRMAANDMAVPPGRIVYTGLLNARGGYESDLTVFRLAEDRYMLVTGSGQGIRDAAWLRRHIGEAERVAITDVTAGLAVLALTGPNSRDILASVSDADLSLAGFSPYSHREIAIGPATVRAARLSYVGELGWELYSPPETAAGVYDRLIAAGAEHGLRNAGIYALTSLRLEKGYRAWGPDVTPDDTPLEAGLGFAVAWDKPIPFLGRDALLRQREAGIEKRLVHLRIMDDSVHPLGDEAILQEGRIVGQVRSAAFGHTLGCGVAIGYISIGSESAEAMIDRGGFEIEMALERFRAALSLAPFHDPEGRRMRV